MWSIVLDVLLLLSCQGEGRGGVGVVMRGGGRRGCVERAKSRAFVFLCIFVFSLIVSSCQKICFDDLKAM